MNPITYTLGADVYNHQHEKVGTIDRLVIDPRTNEVTHIVVHKGFLFTEDKVIPTPMVNMDEGGHLMLSQEITGLDGLPDFEQVQYISADSPEFVEDDLTNPNRLYWYPPLAYGAALTYPPFYPDPVPQQVTVTEQNIPEGSVALKQNASVYSRDDKHIGNISQIFTDPNTNKATFFAIQKGIFLTEDKLVPTWWVDVTGEDTVRLTVDSSVFDRLPAFEPTS